MAENARAIIIRLLRERSTVTSRELAEAAGLTRQAIHPHLVALQRDGVIASEGRGRATRYHVAAFSRRYPTDGLAEDTVWRDVLDAVDELRNGPVQVTDIVAYTLTEMVNNVIDHSAAREVDVRVRSVDARWVIEVRDEGRGAFSHLTRHLGLDNPIAAVQEVSKGKVTTDPQHHTGEGIFFSSKAVDVFELASAGLVWVVDNQRGDHALGTSDVVAGTTVRLEIDRDSTRSVGDVFDAYTDDHRFNRSRAVVTLFEYGERFVSRSEAKRVARGLERFDEVVVDFTGVRLVGQGFVDELFRVWTREHPSTTLEPVGMNDAVAFMVRRGLPTDRSP
ncbi:MAG: DUF4325 domain-containing protein [Actinobacteria bacterium]|nr:DUF4325 domain-containing protein [Actinomycetota bacterium]